MITMLDTTKTNASRYLRKRYKSPNYSIGVKRVLKIHDYCLSYRMGFKSFLSLILIVDRFMFDGGYSTYTGVFDQIYDIRNGACKRVLVKSIDRLVVKGLIKSDNSSHAVKLYPTEKALREVSKFL